MPGTATTPTATQATEEELQRARDDWCQPLQAANHWLPPALVADLGRILTRQETYPRQNANLPSAYVDWLCDVMGEPRFQLCSHLILDAAPDRQGEAVAAAVACIARSVDGLFMNADSLTAEQWTELTGRLTRSFADRNTGDWLAAGELIAVHAVAQYAHGAHLVDQSLYDHCLGHWGRAPLHRLTVPRTPLRRSGDDDLSHKPGDINALTGVRIRRTEPLHHILAAEWALTQHPKCARVGWERILNGKPLVYSRESPCEIIPRHQVLVLFILDLDSTIHTDGILPGLDHLPKREAQRWAASLPKALAYKMICDAAEQAPGDRMSVDVAIYVADFATEHDSLRKRFALADMAGPLDGEAGILRLDGLAPFFFLSLNKVLGLPHAEADPALPDDPFALLSCAGMETSGYTSVLAVIHSLPGRWPRNFECAGAALRPVAPGQPAVLLVETALDEEHGTAGRDRNVPPAERVPELPPVGPALDEERRTFRFAKFLSLQDASLGHSALQRERDTSQLDVRNAFLDMLLGPIGVLNPGLGGFLQ